MIDTAALAPGLDHLRDLVQVDGGDIELVGTEGTTVTLALVLEDAHCRECVMPRPFLEQIATDVLGKVPGVDAVSIVDPREADG